MPPTMTSAPTWFSLSSRCPGGKVLMDAPDAPGGVSWTVGQRFENGPVQPVPITIVRGSEAGPTPEFSIVPPVISPRLVEVLRAAGVDTLDVYDGVLLDEDDRPVGEPVLLYNLTALVHAASIQTRFSPDNPSRSSDASIDALKLDPARIGAHLLFRLAENTSVVLVHERVKAAVEAAGFPSLRFTPAQGLFTL